MVVWSLQALAEKGVSYNSKYTDLFTGQSLSPDYLAVNPKGTVPALVVQGPDGRQVIPDSRCVTACTLADTALQLSCRILCMFTLSVSPCSVPGVHYHAKPTRGILWNWCKLWLATCHVTYTRYIYNNYVTLRHVTYTIMCVLLVVLVCSSGG